MIDARRESTQDASAMNEDGDKPRDEAMEKPELQRQLLDPVRGVLADDISRFRRLAQGVRRWRTRFGLLWILMTVLVGLGLSPLIGLQDWPMHVGFYVVFGTFVLLYIRAYQQGRRFRRAFWAFGVLALTLFFMWVLMDLIPPRLEIHEIARRPLSGNTLSSVMRPQKRILWWPWAMLGGSALWLASHWLFVRRRERAL